MKPWWEKWSGRLEAEIEAFRDLGLEFRLDQAEKAAERVVLVGNFRLSSGREIPLRVIYPDTFPSTRFTAFATDPRDRLSIHQNPLGGNLCLLPRGSVWWRPSLLAADVISDRIELLYSGARVPAEMEYQQGEPVTTYLGYARRGGIIVTEGCFDVPSDLHQGRIRIVLEDDSWLPAEFAGVDGPTGKALLSEVFDPTGEIVRKADANVRALFSGASIPGVWQRLERKPDPREIEQLEAHLNSLFAKMEFKKRPQIGEHRFAIAGLLIPEETQYGVDRLTWLFRVVALRQKSGSGKAGYVRTLRYGVEARSARVPELRAIRNHAVSLVGLGSLGAPLGVELARAGVSELRVADCDYVDPAGGVRWVSDLNAAGASKTLAFSELVRRNYPYTLVRPFDVMIGDTPLERSGATEGDTLAAWAGGSALLIDATAEENVSRVVSAIGDEGRIPQVYLWSYDAYGGVVARVIPGRTGCFHCLSLHLSPAQGGTFGPLPYAIDSNARRVQPTGCSDPTFTGDFASLMPLVDHAARLAYGLLSEGQAGGYPSYSDDVFVLKLREPDGKLVTPRWTSYSLRTHPECQLYNQASSSRQST